METKDTISELTPSAIYEIFIELCREKLHLVISFNARDSYQVSSLLRTYRSLLTSSVQIVFRVGAVPFGPLF